MNQAFYQLHIPENEGYADYEKNKYILKKFL